MVPAIVVLIEKPTCLAVVVSAVPDASFSDASFMYQWKDVAKLWTILIGTAPRELI